MDIDRRNELYCPACGKGKQKKLFIKNPIPSKNGYLYFCKNCINTKLKEYIELLGNEGASLWCLCMELGLPFMKEVWDKTSGKKAKNKSIDIFATYISALEEMDTKPTGLYDSDMMLSDFFSSGYVQTVDLRKQRESDWGKFVKDDGTVDDEAYDYLEKTFADYTKDLLEMDANLTRRYMDLAKAELRKRKADESGDMNEIKNAQSVLNNQLTLLKLNNFKDNKQSDTEKFIERMAWNIENTKPSECEDTEVYKDYSNFGVKWEDIMRTVKNLVSGSRDYPDIPKNEM